MKGPMRIGGRLLIAVLAAILASPASAQDAPFYKDKTIRFIISAGVAGGYVSYARLLAEHMGRHIPGKPELHRPEHAGRRRAARHQLSLHAGAAGRHHHRAHPLDGAAGAAVRHAGARFDPLKIHWLGSMDRSDGPCTAWHTSPIKTWSDMLDKEFIVGSSGVGSQMELYPVVMNKLFGTKVKVIGGYKDGSSIF